MSTRSATTGSDDLDRIRRQFEQWRRRRSPGTRIPDSLWQAAVAVARRHGVSKACKAARVDYYPLKRRLEAAEAAPQAAEGSAPRRAGKSRRQADRFIEIPLGAMPNGSGCVLEVEDRRGTRLRMELRGVSTEELASLVRSVWSAKQ